MPSQSLCGGALLVPASSVRDAANLDVASADERIPIARATLHPSCQMQDASGGNGLCRISGPLHSS